MSNLILANRIVMHLGEAKMKVKNYQSQRKWETNDSKAKNDLDRALLIEIFKEVFRDLKGYYSAMGIQVTLAPIHGSSLKGKKLIQENNELLELKINIELYGESVGKIKLLIPENKKALIKPAAQYAEMAAELIKEKYYSRYNSRQQQQFHREIDLMFIESNNLICSIGMDGYFKRISKLWIYNLGYPEEELLGKPFTFYVHEEDQDYTNRFLEEITLKGISGHFENRYRTKWGTTRWLSWSVLPLPSQETLFCLVNDITDIKEYQSKVLQNEAHFRATFNQAAVGITHLDLAGNWIKVNEKFCNIIGYSLEEIKGKTFKDITYPDDIKRSIDFFDNILRENATKTSMEKRYIHKGGGIVWVNLTISVVKGSSNEAEYFIAIIEDITSRKIAEAALRESQEFYKSIFQNNKAPKLLVCPSTGEIVDANRAACEFYGYSHKEITAMNIQQINILSEDMIQQEMDSVMSEKYKHLFFRHRLKSGDVRDVEVFSTFISNDKRPLLHSIIHDITDKRQTEQELKKQEAVISTMNARLLRDLEYAKEIQLALNNFTLHNTAVSCTGQYIPFEKVGGDCLGIFEIDEFNIAFYIGDVAGHGVAASLTSIFLHQFMNENRTVNNTALLMSPRELLNQLYVTYNHSSFPEDIYLVMMYGTYNRLTRRLVYASGGLNTKPMILRKNGEIISLEGKQPFPIGKFSELYKPQFDNSTLWVEPGERLLIYTDGLLDLSIKDRKAFDIKNLLKDNSHHTIDILNNRLFQQIKMNHKEVSDDIAYLLLEFK